MSYLLDTNVISAHLRRPRGLVSRFVQHGGQLYISTLSLAEIQVWVGLSSTPATRQRAVDYMPRYEVVPLPFDEHCAGVFAMLRIALTSLGRTVQVMDLLIAATAVAYDLTLVTGNTKHFEMIPDLRLENWLA